MSERMVSIRRIGKPFKVTWRYVLDGELYEREEVAVGASALRHVLRDLVGRSDYQRIVDDVLNGARLA